MNLVSLIGAFIFGALISRLHVVFNNPYSLTLRGRRVLFVASIVVGLLVTQIAIHLWWNCTETACGYIWK